MKLTARESRFVAEYLIDQKQTDAAIRAGFSPRSAKQYASVLMQKPHIKAAIEKGMAKLMNKLEISAERIRLERARLAFFNPKQLYNEDGSLKPIHELDDDTAAAIAGMDIETIGSGKKAITRTAKIKLTNKNESLTALEKMEGMYKNGDGDSLPLNIHLHLD